MAAVGTIFASIFALFAAGMVVLIVFTVRGQLRRRRQRHAAFWELCRTRGWEHLTDAAARQAVSLQPGGHLHGGSLAVADAMLGFEDGVPFVISDQAYTESDGEHSHTYRYSVCQMRLPGPAPRLLVQPESGLSRFGQKFGLADIQLESKAFNDAFNITSASTRFASDVLHPRTMHWLLGYPRSCFLMQGTELLVWIPGSLSIDKIDFMLWFSRSLRAQVPSFVWQFLSS